MAPWLDRMRRVGVLPVARALRLPTADPRGASGGSIGCPACSAKTRHTKTEPTKNPRGAAGIPKNGHGWRCFQCNASGDAIDLVAYTLGEKRYRDLTDHGRADVRRWCEAWTHAAPATTYSAPVMHEAPAPTYSDAAELRAFWDSCCRVDEDMRTRTYLAGRGIDSTSVADLDMARALPDGDVPTWARRWQGSGHRIIVPLVDADGVMRSVLARSLDRSAKIKSLAPAGPTRAGLVIACPFARLLLAKGRPEWWPSEIPLRVVIAEGEVDALAWASQWSDAQETAPAVFGIMSGSWTSDIARRIPDGSHVVIATDLDTDGDRYAQKIVATFDDRKVQLGRWNQVVSP